jgi:hypothetical protein
VKIGARIVRHGRYVVFQLAEVAGLGPCWPTSCIGWTAQAKTAAARSMRIGIDEQRQPDG